MKTRFVLGGGAGLALGLLLPTFAAWLGGGYAAWGLAAGALTIVAIFLLLVPGYLFVAPFRTVIGIVAGPGLFALLGWAFWRFGPQWVGDLPDRALAGAGLPNTWQAATTAGGAVGLAVALVAGNRPVLAGAAFGVLPGTLLGAAGGWHSGVWYVSLLTGLLLAMLLFRSCLPACAIRGSSSEPREIVTLGLLSGAFVGTLVFGIAHVLASKSGAWLGAAGSGETVRVLALDVLGFPGALCNAAGLPAGWLGGAVMGAVALVLLATMTTLPHSIDVVLGLLFGLADHLAGGVVFDTLFGSWRAGAVTGALAGACTFALRSDTGRGTARAVALSVLAGGLAGAAAIRFGGAAWAGAAAGIVAGLLAVPASRDPLDGTTIKPVALLALSVFAAAPLWVGVPAVQSWRHTLAGYAFAGEDDDRAAAEYGASLRANPRWPLTYRLRHDLHRRQGRTAAAIDDLSRVIELDPHDYRWYVMRARVHGERGEHASQTRDLASAFDLAPKFPALLVKRGWAFREAGNTVAALQEFNGAISLDPADPRGYHGRGWTRYDAGEFRAAHADFNEAVVRDGDAENYLGRAWCNVALGHVDQAVEDFVRALQDQPDHARACHGLGRARLKQKDYEGALEAFTRAIEIDGDYAAAYEGRGWARRLAGDAAGARDDFANALALDPNHAGARRGLAGAGAVAPAAPTRPAAAPQSDRERLQGTWRVVRAQRLGEVTHPPAGIEFTFAGDKLRIKDLDGTLTYDYRLNPATSPKQIHVTLGAATRTHAYRFRDGKLEWAYGAPGQPAPPRFTSLPGDTWLVELLERVR